MKLNNLILSMSAGVAAFALTACENSDISFPDSDGGVNVYFAYQRPIRTITLGDISTYGNSKENNEHAFTIYGVSSGSYTGKNIDVEVAVDESLLQGLTFEDGSPVKALPQEYYQLSGSTLHYGGNFRGGVDVKLTDAFFNDPASVGNTYVIPMVMKSATGEVDNILKGTPIAEGAPRQNSEMWSVLPKDYTLFMVNYINKYDANYLRRGVDQITNYKRVADNPHAIVEAGDQTGFAWDNQFWIVSDIPFETGKEWSLKMKVRAKEATSVGTQTHKGLGGYIHWAAIGNVNFTTDWTEFTASGTFSAEQNGGDCIAFNLNHGADNTAMDDANTYYFDEIEFIVDGKVACKTGVAGSWAVKTNIGVQAGQMIEKPYWKYGNVIDSEDQKVRHKEFVESDEVIKATTKSLNSVVLPISGLTSEGNPVTCDILLTFDDSDNCKITSATEGYTAEGTGSFKSKSEIKAWGNKDRDALYLNYTINLGAATYQSSDTLVVRDRGTVSSIREFTTIYKQD